MKKILSMAVICLLLFAVTLVGCDNNNQTSNNGTVADNTEFYTAITNNCKLSNNNYTGKSFLSDGIGKATVAYYTDGDTTSFKLVTNDADNGKVIAVRYFDINTPESTGSIEKWGKAASNFTKSRLSSATEIVLQATADKAEHDSYGSRYLGYVWYRTSENENFKLLNLELVENGFTENKGVNTSAHPYYSYFKEANDFARSIQLRIYSKLNDPLYTTDPVETTVEHIITNPSEYYNDDNETGSKVKFYAVLTDVYYSQTGTVTFTATQFNEDGTTYTIPIYAGYRSDLELGHYYRVIGDLAKHNNNYQITNTLYNPIFGETNMKYTHPEKLNYYLTFDSSAVTSANMGTSIYTNVTVVSSQVENNVLTIVGTSYLRTTSGQAETSTQFTFKVNVAEDYVNVMTAGKTFQVKGFQYEDGVITIQNYQDIKIK